MEKEHWIIRLCKHSWTPIVLGAAVCLAVVSIAKVNSWEAIPAGIGLVALAFISMVRGFSK